jgi:cytochrome c
MIRNSSNNGVRDVAACAAIFCLSGILPAFADEPDSLDFGRPATPAEIAAWDIDVRPDGQGLPPGSGNVADGEKIYAAKCAVCHGKTGVEGPNDRLVVHSPDEPFPDSSDPETFRQRTVGNYWPYATTVFDYIRRSMPQNMPGSLQADEVYSLTAFLLHRNHIVPANARMDAATLPKVRMPARDRFVPDDRLDYKVVH